MRSSIISDPVAPSFVRALTAYPHRTGLPPHPNSFSPSTPLHLCVNIFRIAKFEVQYLALGRRLHKLEKSIQLLSATNFAQQNLILSLQNQLTEKDTRILNSESQMAAFKTELSSQL